MFLPYLRFVVVAVFPLPAAHEQVTITASLPLSHDLLVPHGASQQIVPVQTRFPEIVIWKAGFAREYPKPLNNSDYLRVVIWHQVVC